MKVDTQMALRARTYEIHDGEWREVEPQSRTASLVRGLAALSATALAVLFPLALLAVGACARSTFKA